MLTVAVLTLSYISKPKVCFQISIHCINNWVINFLVNKLVKVRPGNSPATN